MYKVSPLNLQQQLEVSAWLTRPLLPTTAFAKPAAVPVLVQERNRNAQLAQLHTTFSKIECK